MSKLQDGNYSTSELPSGWKSWGTCHLKNLTVELLLAAGFQCWDFRMEKFWHQNFHLDGKLQLCLRDIQARAHSFLLTVTTAIQSLELFFQCRDEMFHVTIFSGDLPVDISDSGTVNGGIVLILGLHDGIVGHYNFHLNGKLETCLQDIRIKCSVTWRDFDQMFYVLISKFNCGILLHWKVSTLVVGTSG